MPDASHSPAHASSGGRKLDVAVVGGGLAGLYAIHRLRGMGLNVRAYEAGSGVGGTWFWNRYPGARCDVESLEYSYRQRRDKLVERVGEFSLSSEIGTLHGYAYVTPFDRVHHMAFVYGAIGDGKGVLARLHRADVIGDVFGGAKSIRASLARFKAAGRGVIVYLRDGTAGVPVAEIPHGDTGADAARSRQWREIGLGAQILKDLGISSIRLLASSKRTYVGLGGFGIEIVATEPLEG